MELHIFDFDGTLFNSPVPSREQVERLYPGYPRIFNDLFDPVFSGGLGWFQNLLTLSPPAVPLEPAVQDWFITPVVNHFFQLVKEELSHCAATLPTNAAVSLSPGPQRAIPAGFPHRKRLFFVLTGRDMKFYQRILALLSHAGLLPHLEEVILKPHETYGTVKYKLEKFAELIHRHDAKQVYYYEDRPEQGGRLFEGIHLLQQRLFSSVPLSPPGSSSSISSSCSARILSFGGNTGIQPPVKELSWCSLFHGKEKAMSYAHRSAERWVNNYVQATGIVGVAQKKDGEKKSPTNPIELEPFHFSMVLLEPSLATLCEHMLSDASLKELVDELLRVADTQTV